ncbi:LamG-like jellyroll fold domain-containing protein [Paenibacillus nasutitermitis]|uniref:BIG2 domain-containing protein n=1 Tax=Paenibacillus nasutitermitis TaxID=1652958 RepID=A0A916YM18_9BACL|nr:LamG-like jellyroll fold domain-containing protein [Paenibacillus nasutitermitis]GGD51418.1 hypothetical protein GCM10010911_06180 [Paenibacillus nasutitermitis]
MKRPVSFVLIISIVMACFITGPVSTEAADNAEQTASRSGTTYYMDSSGGSDSNAGTSPNKAWKTLNKVNAVTYQPGDRILFKAGSSWKGQLWPKGSGSDGHPIVIDRYGSGSKPVIHGAGLSAETLRLFNQQYWEISNLELTNKGADRQTRRAVWIEAQDIGIASHIYLKNLTIRDVNGKTGIGDLESGGIIARVTGSAVPTKFDDLLIQDNTFTDIDSTGIYIRSDWRNRQTRTDGTGPWLGFTNVVIRGNSLNRTGGDAIIVCESESPLIEYNVAAHSYYNSEGYHAGIWAINTDNALFQYNEAYLTHTTLDGMGFDLDELCNNCVMQYNYSHDNEGGFMLLIGQRGQGEGYDQKGIVRYNISQNDRHALISYAGRMDNYQIYNNTFYTSPGMKVKFSDTPDYNNLPTGSMSIRNNIIYNQGTGMSYTCGNLTCTYDSNTFYGNHDPSEPEDPNKLTSDPLLIGAGSGSAGPTDGNRLTADPLLYDYGLGSTGRTTVDGYRLAAGSPAIGSGAIIAGNGGKDYWGNAVSESARPNRGAYNGSGVQEEPVGSGIKSYLYLKDGHQERYIGSAEPQLLTVKATQALIVADANGTKTYYPDKDKQVYLTVSDPPIKVVGSISSMKGGSKYSLVAEPAYRGDDISLKLLVDNRVSKAVVSGQFIIGIRVFKVEAAAGKLAEIKLVIPGSSEAEVQTVTGQLFIGGKPVGRLTAGVTISDPLTMEVAHVLKEDGSEVLRIHTVNVSNRARKLKDISWSIGSQSGILMLTDTIAAGAGHTAEISLAGMLEGTRNAVSMTLRTSDGLTWPYSGETITSASMTKKTISVDGKLDDLSAVPAIELPARGVVQMSGYGGAEDLSGSVWLTWDDDHLYLSARIRDNLFSQSETGGQIWLGDVIQFGASPGMPGEHAGMYEYGMALTSAGPQLYRWSALEGEPGAITSGQLAVERNEQRRETDYELAVPWSELAPIRPGEGPFSFSFLVNDNDGAGRKGWIEWGGGIGGSKDSGLFVPIRLTGPVQRTLSALKINETLAYSASPVSLSLTGMYSDGATGIVTHAQWTSSDPEVAVVQNGTVSFTGKKGPVTITAAYGGIEATVSTVVADYDQYYAFDEGQGNQVTESVTGSIYAIEGEPVWVDGKFGKALFFYGNSIKINPIAKGDFTFMAWINPFSDSYNHTILGQGVTGSQANMFNWWISEGRMYFLASDAEGSGHGMWPFNTDDHSIALNEWTHVAVTRQGTEFKLYINGVNVLTKSVPVLLDQTVNPNPFRIGAQNGPSGGPSEGFHGAIDELRLLPEALSEERIRQLAQLSAIPDQSPKTDGSDPLQEEDEQLEQESPAALEDHEKIQNPENG